MRRRLVLVALALACAPADQPAEPPREVPAARAEPVTQPQPAAAPSEPAEEHEPEGASIGVPQCDAYLELYRKCEPELAPEIAAGNRRTARAEAAWLEHFSKAEKDPGLPASCEAMLSELRKRCPR